MNYGAKGGLTYKLSGRHLFNAKRRILDKSAQLKKFIFKF